MILTRTLAGLTALLGLAALPSCLGPIDTQLNSECDDLSKGEIAYFQDTILNPVLDTHCTICHARDLPEGSGDGTRRGAPLYLNYDIYESATINPGNTWARIADRTMPPMGRELNPDETDLLYEWLNCVAAVEAQGDDDDSAP